MTQLLARVYHPADMLRIPHPARYGRAHQPPLHFLVLLLVLATVAGSSALSQSEATTPEQAKQLRQQIRHLETEWRTALLANDIPTLDRLLDDQYIGISNTGTLQTKEQFLAAHKSGEFHLDRLDYSDVKVRVYGDTAVVTAQAVVQGASEDADLNGRHRFTRVYHRTGGTWKIISFENSRIIEPHH